MRSNMQSEMTVALALADGLHRGRRYTARRISEQFGVHKRTGNRWIAGMVAIAGVQMAIDADGAKVVWLPKS